MLSMNPRWGRRPSSLLPSLMLSSLAYCMAFVNAVVSIAAIIAALTDIHRFKVYNALTFPLLLSGLIFHGVVDGQTGLFNSFTGLAFGFGSLIVFYAMGGVGAGDVKLMAGIGAWLGLTNTVCVFFASSLATGVWAVALILRKGTLVEASLRTQLILFRLTTLGRMPATEHESVEQLIGSADHRGRVIPFAVMVLFGLLVTVWLQGRL